MLPSAQREGWPSDTLSGLGFGPKALRRHSSLGRPGLREVTLTKRKALVPVTKLMLLKMWKIQKSVHKENRDVPVALSPPGDWSECFGLERAFVIYAGSGSLHELLWVSAVTSPTCPSMSLAPR